MTENQIQVINWWHSGKDYITGINLLSLFSKNKVLVNTLLRKQNNYGTRKLHYELPKSVGLNWKDIPEPIQHPNPPLEDDSDSTDETDIPAEIKSDIPPPETIKPKIHSKILDDKNIDSYPPVVRRIIHEYSELYNKRSQLYKNMTSVPETNTAENTEKRAAFLSDIKSTTSRMDLLYNNLELFKNENITPDENILWPAPEETKVLSIDDLKKRRSVLVGLNYKLNNRLKYNSNKKQAEENPMPEGVKKEELKVKIKEHNQEIASLDELIIKALNDASETK